MLQSNWNNLVGDVFFFCVKVSGSTNDVVHSSVLRGKLFCLFCLLLLGYLKSNIGTIKYQVWVNWSAKCIDQNNSVY